MYHKRVPFVKGLGSFIPIDHSCVASAITDSMTNAHRSRHFGGAAGKRKLTLCPQCSICSEEINLLNALPVTRRPFLN